MDSQKATLPFSGLSEVPLVNTRGSARGWVGLGSPMRLQESLSRGSDTGKVSSPSTSARNGHFLAPTCARETENTLTPTENTVSLSRKVCVDEKMILTHARAYIADGCPLRALVSGDETFVVVVTRGYACLYPHTPSRAHPPHRVSSRDDTRNVRGANIGMGGFLAIHYAGRIV